MNFLCCLVWNSSRTSMNLSKHYRVLLVLAVFPGQLYDTYMCTIYNYSRLYIHFVQSLCCKLSYEMVLCYANLKRISPPLHILIIKLRNVVCNVVVDYLSCDCL